LSDATTAHRSPASRYDLKDGKLSLVSYRITVRDGGALTYAATAGTAPHSPVAWWRIRFGSPFSALTAPMSRFCEMFSPWPLNWYQGPAAVM
jgi:hypothetical protein